MIFENLKKLFLNFPAAGLPAGRAAGRGRQAGADWADFKIFCFFQWKSFVFYLELFLAVSRLNSVRIGIYVKNWYSRRSQIPKKRILSIFLAYCEWFFIFWKSDFWIFESHTDILKVTFEFSTITLSNFQSHVSKKLIKRLLIFEYVSFDFLKDN